MKRRDFLRSAGIGLTSLLVPTILSSDADALEVINCENEGLRNGVYFKSSDIKRTNNSKNEIRYLTRRDGRSTITGNEKIPTIEYNRYIQSNDQIMTKLSVSPADKLLELYFNKNKKNDFFNLGDNVYLGIEKGKIEISKADNWNVPRIVLDNAVGKITSGSNLILFDENGLNYFTLNSSKEESAKFNIKQK